MEAGTGHSLALLCNISLEDEFVHPVERFLLAVALMRDVLSFMKQLWHLAVTLREARLYWKLFDIKPVKALRSLGR